MLTRALHSLYIAIFNEDINAGLSLSKSGCWGVGSSEANVFATVVEQRQSCIDVRSDVSLTNSESLQLSRPYRMFPCRECGQMHWPNWNSVSGDRILSAILYLFLAVAFYEDIKSVISEISESDPKILSSGANMVGKLIERREL